MRTIRPKQPAVNMAAMTGTPKRHSAYCTRVSGGAGGFGAGANPQAALDIEFM